MQTTTQFGSKVKIRFRLETNPIECSSNGIQQQQTHQ